MLVMWLWQCRRRLSHFTQQKNLLLYKLFIFVLLTNNLFASAFLFDNTGCLSSCCCCRSGGCPFGINNLCYPLSNLGCCNGLPLLNLQLPAGSLPLPPLLTPRLPLRPPPTQHTFQVPQLSPFTSLCAPPCLSGACSPPLLLAPPRPPSLQVAPIVPVPRILQPPQPLLFVPPPTPPLPPPIMSFQNRICAVPFMQCLMPCRSQSCQRQRQRQQNNYNCCNDCMDEVEEYDDYKKRKRRRRKRMLDLEDKLQKKCYNLLFEKSNKRRINQQQLNDNSYTPDKCHPCNNEQFLRCRQKRMILEKVCQKMQNRLLFEEFIEE